MIMLGIGFLFLGIFFGIYGATYDESKENKEENEEESSDINQGVFVCCFVFSVIVGIILIAFGWKEFNKMERNRNYPTQYKKHNITYPPPERYDYHPQPQNNYSTDNMNHSESSYDTAQWSMGNDKSVISESVPLEFNKPDKQNQGFINDIGKYIAGEKIEIRDKVHNYTNINDDLNSKDKPYQNFTKRFNDKNTAIQEYKKLLKKVWRDGRLTRHEYEKLKVMRYNKKISINDHYIIEQEILRGRK